MNALATIPLRFQRAELEKKADLSPAGLSCLADTVRPESLIQTLLSAGEDRDALYALVLMLPHRQTVWWACLAARLLPGLERQAASVAAIEAAERWVQSVAPADAEEAGLRAEACGFDKAAAWVATAAHWAGPSLAPRGQQPVPPAPHLPGVAARSALLLLAQEPGLEGRVTFQDWVAIGTALMHGENGREAQAALRARIAAA